MLIVGLLGAIVFYVVLYFAFEASQNRMQNTQQVLTTLNNMVLAPQHTIFMIFRGLILISVFYVVADALLSASRKAAKKKHDEAEDMKIGIKRTPMP